MDMETKLIQTSRSRPEGNSRPKISRIDFDLTELEISEVWWGRPKPVVDFHTGFRAPEFLVASAHVRDAVPDDFYELSGLYNKEWHAPLRASTPEAYWEKQKIFFPGGDAFVHREAGSHRGQVLADGALFGDTCHDPPTRRACSESTD